MRIHFLTRKADQRVVLSAETNVTAFCFTEKLCLNVIQNATKKGILMCVECSESTINSTTVCMSVNQITYFGFGQCTMERHRPKQETTTKKIWFPQRCDSDALHAGKLVSVFVVPSFRLVECHLLAGSFAQCGHRTLCARLTLMGNSNEIFIMFP